MNGTIQLFCPVQAQIRARQAMTVVGARIVMELRGVSCLPLEVCPPAKKSITCSRSFGRVVVAVDQINRKHGRDTVRFAVARPPVDTAQREGLNQRVRPVSLFIHESAENRVFAQVGVRDAKTGADNYYKAHQRAMFREAIIRREVGITGGFAGGGGIHTNVP